MVLVLSGCDAIEKAQEKRVDDELGKIHVKVADDAVEQYGIAKRGGDKMQTCVQAGFVKAAYLQAKDEANFRRWSETEKADCALAGVPSL